MDDPAPIAPVEQTPQEPGYTHEDLQKESIREIAENTEIPTPKEEVKEEVKEPEAPVEPQSNVEEIATKAAEEAAKKILEEQAKAEVKEPEPTEKEKAYLDWEKKFEGDNKRQPTYLEALSFVEEQAVRAIEEKQQAQAKEAEETQKAEAARIEEENKRINIVVDDELNELYNADKLTKIKDPNNPYDQGVVERKALFAKWMEVNTERRAQGLPEIVSATRIYDFYYQKPNAQPAGADAPISGNRGSATPPSAQKEYTYADLKKPWSFFGRGN